VLRSIFIASAKRLDDEILDLPHNADKNDFRLAIILIPVSRMLFPEL
jgi:hypothetical protein